MHNFLVCILAKSANRLRSPSTIDNVTQEADLHILPDKIWHFACEPTSIVNGTRWHLILVDDFIGKCNTVIVFTEGGCVMDDTGAILIRHISVHNYAEGSILILRKDRAVRRDCWA
jgi:hypothetical protein